jgi:transposase
VNASDTSGKCQCSTPKRSAKARSSGRGRDPAQALQTEIDDLDAQLTPLVTGVAPQLIALPGVGLDTAGQLLVTAGDNPQRLRSEASFARLCGSAPIPVSSGRTDRHRLHRGGDRQANTALWRIALVRMHCHLPTKDYVARRTAEGKTKTEILRCLKRYIAREVYPLLGGGLS